MPSHAASSNRRRCPPNRGCAPITPPAGGRSPTSEPGGGSPISPDRRCRPASRSTLPVGSGPGGRRPGHPACRYRRHPTAVSARRATPGDHQAVAHADQGRGLRRRLSRRSPRGAATACRQTRPINPTRILNLQADVRVGRTRSSWAGSCSSGIPAALQTAARAAASRASRVNALALASPTIDRRALSWLHLAVY
jgi:hypothetical protein